MSEQETDRMAANGKPRAVKGKGEGKEGSGRRSGEVNLRELVWNILTEHEVHGTYTNVLLKRTQDRYSDLPVSQRAFLKRLTEGTIEREIELDTVIQNHLKDPSIKIKSGVRCLLRMSLYQIFYMDGVPDYAVCSEAVRICKRRKMAQSASFVNGLLRSVCREKEAAKKEGRDYVPTAPAPKTVRTRPSSAVIVVAGKKVTQTTAGNAEKGSDVSAAFAAENAGSSDEWSALEQKYSIPREILKLWADQLGRERLDSLCSAMMEIRPVCMRLDPRLTAEEKEQVISGLQESGVEVLEGRWAKDCRQLRHVPGLAGLPGFAEGKWTVQDESSQLMAQAAGLTGRGKDLAGNVSVYDLCAAPGGKTMLAAAYLPKGKVYSYDLTREKTDRIRSGLGRMKLHNVTVAENDASNMREELFEKADLVICDVPCSGLGVMTRKRDIKYNVTPEKLHSLVKLQKKIAANAARVLKPGAVLIYSTCTINRQENEKMAEYIEKRLGLIPEALSPYLPEDFPGIEGNHVQLFPDVHGTDGFFMARFRKPGTKNQGNTD